MKKVVRTVWIGLLSGLAFLVACTSSNGLTRAEKKQLKAERISIISELDQKKQESQNIEDPQIMLIYKNSELKLRQRLHQINGLLGDEKAGMENEAQINTIVTELDSLEAVIQSNNKPIPCVYGPPPGDKLRDRLFELRQAIQRREGACVYGSPEVMQRYKEETQRLKQEADSIQNILDGKK